MCFDRFFFFFQAEDGIRDLVRSRGLGDVYKRQAPSDQVFVVLFGTGFRTNSGLGGVSVKINGTTVGVDYACLLYTSDAADERSSVDLGGRRIIKKKKTQQVTE